MSGYDDEEYIKFEDRDEEYKQKHDQRLEEYDNNLRNESIEHLRYLAEVRGVEFVDPRNEDEF